MAELSEDASSPQELEVASEAYQRAEAALLEGHYSKAFSHYMLLIKLQPNKRIDVKDNLSLSLRELGEELSKTGHVKELFAAYQQACQLFPECETILNDMGTQLFRLGYLDEAACCFRRALKLDPDFLAARGNLENMCCHLVERWHFRMLNDRRRNESFQSAIHQAIKDGYGHVLDVGTGTGLLSLYAVEGGAQSVFACEMSKTMFEMACDVVATNQMADRIHLIHKKSTEMTVPGDLPERVSLLVTETFDAGLLGEHVLSTLQHAWKNLLKKDHKQCRVIPERAKVYACIVECESIRKQNRLVYPGLQHIELNDVDILANTGSVNHLEDEPYTTERLHSIRGGFKFLSEPIAVAHFNFDSPECIDEYVQGFCHDIEVLVTVNGRVDAIVTWFDLYLDKEHTLSSAPGMHSCWEQVVYPVLPCHLLEKDANENLLVRHGDLLNMSCECCNNALHFRCNRIARSSQVSRSKRSNSSNNVITVQDLQRQYHPFTLYSSTNTTTTTSTREHMGSSPSMDYSATYDLDFPPLLKPSVSTSNLGSTQLYDDGIVPSFLSQRMLVAPSNKMSFFLERTEIGFLNDLDYNRQLCKALARLGAGFESARLFTMMDISQGISVLPLQAVKMGAQEVCVVISGGATGENRSTQQELLCYLTTANSVDPQRITFSSQSVEESCGGGGEEGMAASEEWGVLVAADVVETCGCLRQQVLDDIALARVTSLRPSDGLVVPHSVKVYGMAIESAALHHDSAVVSDDSMCGFLVAAFMNDFQMTTHLDVDLSTLDYKKLSEPFELFSFNFNDAPRNKVPAYLDLQTTFKVKAVESGQVTAVVYWFDLELVPDLRVCTLSPNMHWNQAAVMQKLQVTVSCGTEIIVKAACKNSCIGITINLP